MTEEKQILNTLKQVYESNNINIGMCLHVTAILIKYFEIKNIKIKAHMVFLENQDTELKMINHNWISYKGKKCDITADKQIQGFNSSITILDQIISNKNNDNVKIISLAKQKFDLNQTPPSHPKELLNYNMSLQATKSDDSSFSNLLIDEYIEQQNTNFKDKIKNLKFDSKTLDLIEIIKSENRSFKIDE